MVDDKDISFLKQALENGQEIWWLNPNNNAYRCKEIDSYRDILCPYLILSGGYAELNNTTIESFLVPIKNQINDQIIFEKECLEAEVKILYSFINREMQMTATDSRITELKKEIELEQQKIIK